MDPRAAALALVLVVPSAAGCLAGSGTPQANATSNGSPKAGPDQAVGAPGPDDGDHVHDLWKGRRTVQVFDDDVEVRAWRADAAGNGTLADRVGPRYCDGDAVLSSCIGRATFRPPASTDGDRPNVVPPGTGTVRAEVSWEDASITGVRLRAVVQNGLEVDVGTLTEPGTVEVAAPDIADNWTHFPVHWTDDGHARRSSWIFVLTAAGNGTAPLSPAVADGTVHVTVRADRAPGPLPIEPPHPDWWNGTETYQIAQAQQGTSGEVQVWWASFNGVWIHVHPSLPVPPGTEAIHVRVRLDDTGPTQGQGIGEADVRVLYALHGWQTTGFAEVVGRDNGTVLYRIPVQDRMTDSVYACDGSQSSWSFRAETTPRTAPADDPVLGEPVGAHAFEGRVNVTVAATRDPGASWDDLDPAVPGEIDGCDRVRSAYRVGPR